jgi:hypothetical protein
MASTPYPFAMPEDLIEEVRETASETGFSNAAVVRQSIKLGLPRLRDQLSVSRGLKPLTKAECREAFAADPDWERLEGVMARRPVAKPEGD